MLNLLRGFDVRIFVLMIKLSPEIAIGCNFSSYYKLESQIPFLRSNSIFHLPCTDSLVFISWSVVNNENSGEIAYKNDVPKWEFSVMEFPLTRIHPSTIFIFWKGAELKITEVCSYKSSCSGNLRWCYYLSFSLGK